MNNLELLKRSLHVFEAIVDKTDNCNYFFEIHRLIEVLKIQIKAQEALQNMVNNAKDLGLEY